MAFENLSEQLKESIQTLKSRITESESYNQLEEAYNNLPPRTQKLVLILTAIVISALLINIPFQSFLVSNENLSTYKEQKTIIQNLNQAVRLNSQADFQPQVFDLAELQRELSNRMTTLQINESQIKLSPTSPDLTGIPKKVQTAGFSLFLSNLNVRQISKVANMLENFNDSILLTGFKTNASKQNPHYFDTEFILLNFYLQNEDSGPPGLNAPFRGR